MLLRKLNLIIAIVVTVIVTFVMSIVGATGGEITGGETNGETNSETTNKTNNKLSAESLPKYLYHGSKYEIQGQLEPRPSGVIDGEKAVFATNERWLALVFIPKHTDADLSIGFAQGIPYIMEMYDGAFDKLRDSGYIYKVSSDGFRSDPRLGMRHHEFINDDAVDIIESEHIGDVLAELKKTDVKFVSASDSEEFIKKYDIPV